MSRDWGRERWRKFYTRESLDGRLLPLVRRALRDYLLRDAEDDGRLVRVGTDPVGALCRALGAHPEELDAVRGHYEFWMAEGYLQIRGGYLWIVNLPDAQGTAWAEEPELPAADAPAAEDSPTVDHEAPVPVRRNRRQAPAPTPEAERARRYRDRQRDGKPVPSVTISVTERDDKRDADRDGKRDDKADRHAPLSPHTPLSPQKEREKEREQPPRASVTERDDKRDGSPVTERDANAASVTPIPCPSTLALTAEQRGTLQTGLMVPDWAIDELTRDFVINAQANPDDRRTLVVWRKCLSKAVAGNWNNPARRPKRPEQPSTEDAAKEQARNDYQARERRYAEQEARAKASGGVPCPPELLERMGGLYAVPGPGPKRTGKSLPPARLAADDAAEGGG